MDILIDQIFTLLTTPPGNLIYHLVLSFSAFAALQATLSQRHSQEKRRLLIGLSLLIVGQLILFISSGLAWQNLVDPHILLPPIDRAVTFFSTVWIIWLWAFPERARLADTANILLNLLVIVLFGLTFSMWSIQNISQAFNTSLIDLIWQSTTLALTLLGLILVLVRRPDGWANGTAMLSLLALGHIAQLFITSVAGDFSPVVRIMQLIAYPLLLTLPNRQIAVNFSREVTPVSNPSLEIKRRYSTDPKAFYAFLDLAIETNANKMSVAIAHSIAQAILADLCYLITLPSNDGTVTLQGGYDLIREEKLDGTVISREKIPQLSTALERGRPLRWIESKELPGDLKELGTLIGINPPGPMMLIPLLTDKNEPFSGLLLFSPYSCRQWSTEDQNFLSAIGPNLTKIILRAQNKGQMTSTMENAQSELAEQQKIVTQLRTQNNQIQGKLDALQHPDTQVASFGAGSLADLLTIQEESQLLIDQLRTENEQLKSELNGLKSSQKGPSHFEEELKLTLAEVAHLQNQLGEANFKILKLDDQTANLQLPGGEQAEVVASISQELRQPMSSIMGYTDLLLGESVGIVGALQRKFLERIKASIERMRSLINDLIQITSLDINNPKTIQDVVDMGSVIDNALSSTSAQVREKNISLRVDLPEEMPIIHADRDAIQQIAIHLLQNASLATPVEGNISLRVHIQRDDIGDEYVLLQVTDNGGGIAADDLPRVFSRLYRADNPLIQGVGDTGVGLSIAKTLVESHGGRIWVDTEPGISSSFSVILPIYQAN